MRRSKGRLHRGFCGGGVGHHPLRLAETQRQAEGWEPHPGEGTAPGVPLAREAGDDTLGVRQVLRLGLGWKQGQGQGSCA